MNKFLTVAVASTIALSLAGCAPLADSPLNDEPGSVSVEDAPQAQTDSAEAETGDVELTAPEAEGNQASDGSEVEADSKLASAAQTEKLLTYLIEEEKLAHDVYTVLYEQYGAKVFGNILESEANHQDQVMTLLDLYGVADPRSSELGVFNDPELQALFDQLIGMGSQSAADAYQVGVLIEEKDIADISAQLATATDQAVVDVLEKLRSASENHLRAFNRQL
jgi:hypothetical protein